jgi:localization factor PodJL
MGSTAPQENPDLSPPREQAAARNAVLAAARRVAERDGVLDMSLTSVARDAGLAPAAVYTWFTSKSDLLLAVIADDLATLAREMRGGFGSSLEDGARDALPNPSDEMASAVEDSADNSSNHSVVDGAGQPPAGVDTSHDSEPERDAAAPTQDIPRRFPVVQARREPLRIATPEAPDVGTEAIARLQETVARLEARPVDAWLERRLREFERALSALEGRHAERGTTETGVEERLRELQQNLEQLDARHRAAGEESARSTSQRLEAAEQRLREFVSDVQSDATHLGKRLTALENAAFAARPEFFASQPAADRNAAGEPAPAAVTPDAIAPTGTAVHSDTSSPSYLAAARRSAQAAAVARDDHVKRASKNRSHSTLLYLALGSLFVFVALLVGAGLLLRDDAMKAEPVRAAAPLRAPIAGPHKAIATRRVARTNGRMHPATTDGPSRLRQLAEGGDAQAELLVGLQYLSGDGMPRNDAAAFEWLARSAAKGQPIAQYSLGMLCEEGRGVRPDPVQAFQWYGSAALRGNRRAMHSLAIAYAEGLGTAKNLPEAARWFARAAALGSVNSQFNLGVLYERGMGVPQSLTEAYKWYAIAAAQGDRESQARITALASTLAPKDLESAGLSAGAFKPEPIDPAANFTPKPTDFGTPSP